ncbi:hypothetical protein LCGC14_1015990 [marine sediment metagenome]|uniref:BEACH domain-containing protein n=1 Tax=marine sediment metagenome TaxID=412755 RepID=A0A0F9MYS9_9ZZZZ
MNKTEIIHLDTPIWDVTKGREYALAFVYIFTSPVIERDAIHWADYVRSNKN